jgi:hypothetical protein
LGEYGVHRLMQIAVVERQVLSDALFEGTPVVLKGVEVRGVGGQEGLRAPSPLNELARFGGLRETRVVIDHQLAWFQHGHHAVLPIGCKERGVAGPLAHERRDQFPLVEGIDQTHTLRTPPRLLAPARFALRTPAVRAGFRVIPPGLLQLDDLLSRDPCQLLTKLFPQLFVPLGLGEGLFLCV